MAIIASSYPSYGKDFRWAMGQPAAITQLDPPISSVPSLFRDDKGGGLGEVPVTTSRIFHFFTTVLSKNGSFTTDNGRFTTDLFKNKSLFFLKLELEPPKMKGLLLPGN